MKGEVERDAMHGGYNLFLFVKDEDVAQMTDKERRFLRETRNSLVAPELMRELLEICQRVVDLRVEEEATSPGLLRLWGTPPRYGTQMPHTERRESGVNGDADRGDASQP